MLFSVALHIALTLAGTVQEGGSCSTSNDHIDSATLKFVSECSDQTFCSNGTCLTRRCRRDEYPFGYDTGAPIPPLCPSGSFCPDEGSGCRPLVSVGQHCQLNRDEQCAPPPDWQDLASSQNFNGSICLRSTCMFANISFGSSCMIDHVAYAILGPDGKQYQQILIRDNCQTPKLHCDDTRMVCKRTESMGVSCLVDQECETGNCGVMGVCEAPPEAPLSVSPWLFALTAICISAVMATTCAVLTLVHKQHRLERHQEIQDYYYEQLDLRQSIVALHAAAADRSCKH